MTDTRWMVIMKSFWCIYLLVMTNVQTVANSSIYLLNGTTVKTVYFDDNLIDTPGCTIPNIWVNQKILEPNDCKNRCGKRAVYIDRLENDNIMECTINETRMKEYFGNKSVICCYQFAYQPLLIEKLVFTDCRPFKNGTKTEILHEIVTVTCRPLKKLTDNYVYNDAYLLIRKLETVANKNDGNSWNVLLLGMDTMSRRRAIQSMPKLVKYFKENDCIDYRGFQKSEANTIPNLMIANTGMYNFNMLYKVCKGDRRFCNDLFMWTKFKSSGFVTAYGEDGLPYTFENIVSDIPTDHYIRAFFTLGMRTQGNVLCLRTRSSAHHILNYAYQFARAYKNDKYFGYFWISNYSHNPNNLPTLLEDLYIDLFKKLNDLDALNNTIIFFVGDHGVRYGQQKIPVASFYDDRLPMLYMWFPYSFRQRYVNAFHNLIVNQYRLTTHSDLYSTLWNILQLSDKSVKVIPPRYCPKCSTLLKKKSIYRRCDNANITPKWCSCYVLNDVQSTDIAATLVPEIVLYRSSQEQDTEFEIKKILRHHWFRDNHEVDNNITYYVIAIQMIQGDRQFEAVVKRNNSDYYILGDVDYISPLDQYYDTSQC